MLVYRVIPNFFVSILDCRRGYHVRILTSEDALYRLGYMNFSDAFPYFRVQPSDPILGGQLNTFKPINEKTKSFYLFPWDAIRNSRSFYRYSNNVASVFEYNIPDEILSEHIGFGFYGGEEIPEFRIPLSDLKGTSSFLGEIDDEFKNLLITTYREEVKGAIEMWSPIILRENVRRSEEFKEWVAKMQDKIKSQNNSEFIDSIGPIFDYLGLSFFSETITDRRLLISIDDAMILNKHFIPIERIQDIVERSNGMLSMDDFNNWHDYIKTDSSYEKRIRLKKDYFPKS